MNPLELLIGEDLLVPLGSADLERPDDGSVPVIVSGELLPPIVDLEVRDGVPYCGLRRAPDAVFQHPARVAGPSRLRAAAAAAPGSPAARELYGELVRLAELRGPLLEFTLRRTGQAGDATAPALRGSGFISAVNIDPRMGVWFELIVTALVDAP